MKTNFISGLFHGFVFFMLATPAVSAAPARAAEPQLLVAEPEGYLADDPILLQAAADWHLFYNAGSFQEYGVHAIYFRKSADLKTWSPEKVALDGGDGDTHPFAPAIVRFNAGDGDFFYMAYLAKPPGSDRDSIFVARSLTLEGPWLKHTKRETWEAKAKDAAAVLNPQNPHSQFPRIGLSAPKALVKDGKIYLWAIDDTLNNKLELFKGSDFTHWESPVVVKQDGFIFSGYSVKLDTAKNEFFMLTDDKAQADQLRGARSQDGLKWKSFGAAGPSQERLGYAQHPAIVSDDQGRFDSGDLSAVYNRPNPKNHQDLYLMHFQK